MAVIAKSFGAITKCMSLKGAGQLAHTAEDGRVILSPEGRQIHDDAVYFFNHPTESMKKTILKMEEDGPVLPATLERLASAEAVRGHIALAKQKRDEIQKTLDDHIAKNERRHDKTPVGIDRRLPHQGDVIVAAEKAELTNGDINAEHPNIKAWEEKRLVTERAPDATTGLIDRRHHDPTLERAYALAQTGEPVAYADFDIANQGGLNEHMGADALADPHLKGMVQVVNKVVSEAHPGSQVMRKGGDEYAVFAPGVTGDELEKTLAKAKSEVHNYTVEHGLDKISRKLPETAPYGTGIHYGVVDLREYDSATAARQSADKLTELDKQRRKESHYVNLEQAKKSGAIASGEELSEGNNSSTGSTPRSAQEENTAEWWNGLKWPEQRKILRAVGSSLGAGVEWSFIPPEVKNNIVKKKESIIIKTVGQRPPSLARKAVPSKDDLLAAIALNGGLNLESAGSEWGGLATDAANDKRKNEDKPYSEIFGQPIFRKNGGSPVESMAEILAENGYLSRDENGKHDLIEFEEKLSNALSGKKVYSVYNQKAGEAAYEAQMKLAEELAAQEEEENLQKREEQNDADISRTGIQADEVLARSQERDLEESDRAQEDETNGEITEHAYDPFDDPFSTDEEKAAYLETHKGDHVKEQLSLFGSNQLDLDFREGTTDAEKRHAAELLNSLSGTTQADGTNGSGNSPRDIATGLPVRGPVGTLLASAISTAFRTKGVFDFTGQQINSAGDLAAIAQVYRNPSFETLRYFFTKNGIIIGHTGVSSRLPGVSLAMPTSAQMSGIEWVKSQMEAYGADGLWLVHNHPSGRVNPSSSDKQATAGVIMAIPGFGGHIIINHNKYGLLSRGNTGDLVEFTEIHHKFTDEENHIHTPAIPHQILGRHIGDGTSLVQAAYELQIKDGHILIIAADPHHHIRGLMEIPVNTPKTKFAWTLRKLANQVGGSKLFAVLPENAAQNIDQSEYNKLKTWASEAVHNGFLTEAIDMRGYSALVTMGGVANKEKVFGKPVKGYEVSRTGPIHQDSGDAGNNSAPKATGLELKPPTAKLTDFGEKIGGARKDYAAKLEAAKNLDIATEPFSKTWPEPDYKKMIEQGYDPDRVSVLRAIRDEIPDKPRQSRKIKQWVALVESLRNHADLMLNGDSPAIQRTLEKLQDANSAAVNIRGRAELYKAVGHDVSLRGVTLNRNHYSVYHGEKDVTKWQVEQKQKATVFSNMPRELGVGSTKEEAIADFRTKIDLLAPETKGNKPTEFIVYSRRGKEGYVVGKKIGKDYVDMVTVPTAKEAHEYIKTHRPELEAQLAGMKEAPSERGESNAPRTGASARNGKDVTPNSFKSSFGFRGVEFGNSMTAPERQTNLNETYDALHDMADILGLPTQAISLNGELGLAFGARGHGGKNAPAAHYEPEKIVINLTRNRGPGSLAHEWFHAVDSYLSRQRGYKGNYITNSPVKYGPNDATRQELIDAFKKLSGALNDTNLKVRSRNLDKTRTKDYWSTGIEMHARAFENYVIDKLAAENKSNDYLANVKGASAYAEDLLNGLMAGKTVDDLYPYLLPNEIEKVVTAFDNLFAAMQTRQTDKGMAIYEDAPDYNPTVSDPGYTRHLDMAEEAIDRGDIEEAERLLDKAAAMQVAKILEAKAATPKAPEDMRTTGIKNAVTEEERLGRGDSPVEVETRRSFGDAFDRGKSLVDSGKIDPRLLATQMAETPRPLSAEESVALIYDRMRLQNDHKAVMDALEKARIDNDEVSKLENTQRLAKIEDDIQTNDEAARRTGYEQGLGLAARKMMAAEDYSLARTLQRARVAGGEKDVTPELRKKLEELTRALEEAEKKSAEYEAKIKELESTRKVKVVVERMRTTVRPTGQGAARKAIDAEFKGLANQLKGMMGRINSVIIPVDQAAILAQMARNRVVAGIKDAGAIIDDIYLELSDIPDLEKRDIRDAISGYGKTSKLTQDEINVDLREARRQMRLISALEDASSGESPLKSGMQRDPISDEVRELQRQIKDAMREMGIDNTSNRSSADQWKTAIDGIKTRLKNEIYDLDKQIATGKRTVKDRNIVDYDEEAKQLKTIRDEKKSLLNEIDAKPPKSEEELQKIALRAYKTRTAARIIELERKLATGDFEKKARRILNMDEESMRLKNEAEKAKEAVDHAIRERQLANRTTLEKGLDWTKKWRRAVILSGATTIAKLTMAATMRQIITPFEEIVGTILHHTPYISGISKMAPREGGGLNVRAEAEAFVQWFKKQTYLDIKDVAKTGQGSLDRLYGHKHDAPPEAIEFFGRIHGALKVTPKRAEFFRSLQKRTEHAIANGIDVSSPTVQATLTAASYVDANRAIFMNENTIVSAYRILINQLRNKSSFGNIIATMIELQIPIVKIPTNFVGEVFSYAAGGLKAGAKLASAGGREKLTDDDADYIMRNLKKQGIGMLFLAAVIAMAESGIIELGGYYERGEKRELGEAKAGGMKIHGKEVPKWALHTPLFELAQMAATIIRTKKHYAEWNENPKHEDKQKDHATAAGIYHAAAGLIEEVPFIGQTERTLSGIKNIESAGQYGAKMLESMLIPPDVRKISNSMDKAGSEQIPRKASNLKQVIQASIPGQRQKLPVDIERFKRMPLSRAQEIMDNAPPDVQDELWDVYTKKQARYNRYGTSNPR